MAGRSFFFVYLSRSEICNLNQYHMKTLNIYFTLLFLLIMSACTDDLNFLKNEGDDLVTLKLDFKFQGGKEIVVSRATAEQEKQLYDLHFYIFDANGRLTGYEKIVSEEGSIPSEGSVSIRTKSGTSYIYALANINKSTNYYLSQDDLTLLNVSNGETSAEHWSNINESQLTRDYFLSIQFQREYGDENKVFSPDPAGNVFMMSGYINDGAEVNIDANGNISSTSGQNVIKLYRILSKITLNIKPGAKLNGTFTPKYYRLCNVPIGGSLLPKAGISTNATYLKDNITSANAESSYRWNFDGSDVISFYYPENLQVAKPNSLINTWKDREKNSWTNNTKTFTYAANKAAYIEISGDFLRKTNTETISASVTYTIHFGDFGKDLTDYNLIRNYAYIYTVTVNGVNDIQVEAQTTSDENTTNDVDNPYAEGMIVDATAGKHFEVDAHYEARVLSFNKETIRSLRDKTPSSGYIFSVKTPFGETKEIVNVKDDGVYNISGDKLCGFEDVTSIFNGETDYQWVKFVRNYYKSSNNTNLVDGRDVSRSVCKYPGDNNCLNVFQLLKELYNYDTYTDNNGTTAYYTCFIDENYYANKPWSAYVNKEPRNMLLANELDVSSDGQSLYAEVSYSISQRSISTFYTTDYYPNGNNVLVKAFGTETFDEEKEHNKRFSNNTVGNIDNYQDWNARSSAVSTMNLNANKGWYNNMIPVEGTQPLYDRAAKACMSRNRDLDGDGDIDGDEVRWYLAAVDQYRALFYGQNALNPDAYLISRPELAQIDTAYNGGWVNDLNGHTYRSKYHYFTCSGNDKATFWPEEGLTNNPMVNDSWVSEAQLVRCIRTLVSNSAGLENPEKFYSYDTTTRTFNLGGIKATRNYTEAPLEVHNEIEASNNLYSSFVVAKNDLNGTHDFASVTGNDTDPCAGYQNQTNDNTEKQYSWRTPNQKEIALMVAEALLTSNQSYATRTRFSGDDKGRGYWDWHNTPGFWTNTQQINVGTGYENGLRIRCVRDRR